MVNVLRSIRGRITLVATALVAVTLVAASLVLMQWVQADLLASAQDSIDEALEAQADEFGFGEIISGEALAIEDGLEDVTMTEPADFVQGYADGSEIFIGLFDDQGEGLAYGEMFVDGVPAAGLVIEVETGEIVEIFDIGFVEPLQDEELAAEIESLAFDVLEVADADGSRFLVGAAPLDEVEQSIAAIRSALMVIVPSLVLVFALLTWWLTGRALRPVMSITDQVEAISTTSLDRRVPVPDSGDEVANLATVMNRMLDRLERGGDRQRQFSADASHELRSPLSTVRAAAEMLGGDPPKERARRLAQDIVAESDRMDELISDLLELSRLDEDRRSALLENVELVSLVQTELATELDSGTIQVAAPATINMVGSPRQLRRLVRNLADNAMRHADQRVVLSLSTDNGHANLAVDDDGAGVSNEEKQAIFERFSRLDEARSRDAGGSGLGLALVKAIVENHEGTVSAQDSELGGARFVVTLPTSPVIPDR